MSGALTIRKAMSQDMAACAGILNDWIDEAEWMPRLHTRAAVVKHYQTDVASARHTLVAISGSRVRGFLTTTPDRFITALYVAQPSRRQGIGRVLLGRAKQDLGQVAMLYTFQANRGAQAFYARQGFVEINRTTGDNEESLPDILLEWRA
jgi:ribosomal protein S18 acetylase RimI-like enzyme